MVSVEFHLYAITPFFHKCFFNQGDIMSTKWNVLRLTLCVGAILAVGAPINAQADLQDDKEQSQFAADLYYKNLLQQVHNCVNYNQNIPNKEEIHQLINDLETSQLASQSGEGDFRAKFLIAQVCIEHVLNCSQILGEITNLTGIVHMPMPAAPLCTNLEDPSLGDALDVSIAVEEDKLLTVRSRPQMIRDYLEKGGILFVAYPKYGMAARTVEQQHYYREAVEKYSEVLFDVPLACNAMDPNLIGATYAFKRNDQWFVFSMKARQAGTPQEDSEWALWFGKINQPIILKRVNEINEYIMQNQGPNLKQFILKSGR